MLTRFVMGKSRAASTSTSSAAIGLPDAFVGSACEIRAAASAARTSLALAGDAGLYTSEMLEQRFALRNNAVVTDALHTFWLAVLRSVQSTDDPEALSTTLNKAGYHVLLCALL